MRLMYPFIMTPLTFMYLTRKGTSDIMRSEHTRPYYSLFFDLTHLNAEGGGVGGGEFDLSSTGPSFVNKR